MGVLQPQGSNYVLETKGVQDLRGMHFLIPSYQRGYRWTSEEVRKLLNDLLQFAGGGTEQSRSYCLQPLVVFSTGESNTWEVIDGQQRLTTIFLVLKHLKPDLDLFSLTYETRSGSGEFLRRLEPWIADPDSNIDYHHISQAWKTIGDWFRNHEDLSADDKIRITLLNSVKFIWYGITDGLDVRMEVFNRLNIGKIPLTNAELIKALLLRTENFPLVEASPYVMELNREKRQEARKRLARQWDEIERELQGPEFWAFVNGKGPDLPNRIELILRLIVQTRGKSVSQTFSVFDDFELQLAGDGARPTVGEWVVTGVWETVLRTFRTLREWYSDPEGLLFHLTAYSIAHTSMELVELLSLASQRRKSEFVRELQKRIRKDLGIVEASEILGFSYDTNKKAVEKALVLFNVGVVLKLTGSRERLSFHHLNSQVWSLEHIHAQNSEDLTEKKEWDEWLQDHREALVKLKSNSAAGNLCDTLVAKIDGLTSQTDYTKKQFDVVFTQVVQFFSEGPSGIDPHDIGNLALLDKVSNSALNNAVFEVKNLRIKRLVFEGAYVVPGTRNVFQKYYSTQAGSLYYWTEKDQLDYRKALVDHIDVVLKGGLP